MRRLVLILALTAASVAAVPAVAQAGGADNVVLVNTTGNAMSLGRSSLQTALLGGSTVSSSNIADAEAHDCTGCRSVAVAVQALFDTRRATTFTPSNAAIAANTNCTGCTSFAFAYQYVVQTDGPVYLSPAGLARLSELRQEFAAAAASGLPPAELDTQLQQLAGEFKAVIDQELLAAGRPAAGSVHEQVMSQP